jgi:hypothetical protein
MLITMSFQIIAALLIRFRSSRTEYHEFDSYPLTPLQTKQNYGLHNCACLCSAMYQRVPSENVVCEAITEPYTTRLMCFILVQKY